MKTLEIEQRPSKMVSLRLPLDTLEQLKKVATAKELGYQSLLKLYIGEGLRKDLAEMGKQSLLSETKRFLTIATPKRMDSVTWHRKWQATLDKDRFFDQVFADQ